MFTGVICGVFLWKLITISFVLLLFTCRWLHSHHLTKSLTTPLYSCSFPTDTHPTLAVSLGTFGGDNSQCCVWSPMCRWWKGRERAPYPAGPPCCRLPHLRHTPWVMNHMKPFHWPLNEVSFPATAGWLSCPLRCESEDPFRHAPRYVYIMAIYKMREGGRERKREKIIHFTCCVFS